MFVVFIVECWLWVIRYSCLQLVVLLSVGYWFGLRDVKFVVMLRLGFMVMCVLMLSLSVEGFKIWERGVFRRVCRF